MDWPLLDTLGEADRTRVLAAARRRGYRKGEVVFHEGDPATGLHLMVAGRVAVLAYTEDGDTTMLNVLGPGSFFGELSLLGRDATTERSATVEALEPVETLLLPAAAFRALCDQHPEIESLLSQLLAARVRELSGRLVETLHAGLDRRVYRRLVELSALYAPGESAAVVPLTQSGLASLAGGSRPAVNQVLQRLVAREVVALRRGSIEVLDVAELRRRAGV